MNLRYFSPARVALGRTGNAIPLRETLAFQLAHAKARDAVFYPFNPALFEGIHVKSQARDRHEYLRRPDLGRRLDPESKARLASLESDTVYVICDGLSALAVEQNAPRLLELLPPAQTVICQQGRVAVGDEIGELLQASLAIVFIGERPGLSAADSMGVYLTWNPHVGRTDAERNCISNIRPEGLSPGAAAELLGFLMTESRRRGLSGVALKAQSSTGEKLESSASRTI